MVDEDAHMMRRVRATRHDVPALAAGNAARRKRYGAALEQFEELLVAARAVAPAARPLPLFYALAQAGAAIASARLSQGGGVLAASHGLTFKPHGHTLSTATVAPSQRRGAFHDVAAATRSPVLIGAVSLSGLWASLPESSGDPLPNSEHPAALLLQPDDLPSHSSAFLMMTNKARAWLHDLPKAFGHAPDRVAFLKQYLQTYPSATGWESTSEHGVVAVQVGDDWRAHLQWQMPESTGSGSQRFEYLLTEIAPRYNDHGTGWLRPKVGSAEQPLSLLMTWWALLFGLSNLARYYPEHWVEMLAIDRSPEAATLEAMVEDALTAIPRLVLSALRTATP